MLKRPRMDPRLSRVRSHYDAATVLADSFLEHSHVHLWMGWRELIHLRTGERPQAQSSIDDYRRWLEALGWEGDLEKQARDLVELGAKRDAWENGEQIADLSAAWYLGQDRQLWRAYSQTYRKLAPPSMLRWLLDKYFPTSSGSRQWLGKYWLWAAVVLVVSAGVVWWVTRPAPVQLSGVMLNTNIVGGDITHIKIDQGDERVCAEACAKQPECKAWTYLKRGYMKGGGPMCSLKRSAAEMTQDTNCISGRK